MSDVIFIEMFAKCIKSNPTFVIFEIFVIIFMLIFLNLLFISLIIVIVNYGNLFIFFVPILLFLCTGQIIREVFIILIRVVRIRIGLSILWLWVFSRNIWIFISFASLVHPFHVISNLQLISFSLFLPNKNSSYFFPAPTRPVYSY